MPPIVPNIDILVLLLLAGLAFFVEKYYVQRWTVAANAIILWSTFGAYLSNINGYLAIWIVISIVAAAVAVATYIYQITLPIHDFFFIFYSSKTVLGVLLATAIGFLEFALIFIIAIWAISIHFFNHPIPFLGD